MSTPYDADRDRQRPGRAFLAARLAGAGMRTALVEREHLGGTCVNDGCMPDQDAGRERTRRPRGAAAPPTTASRSAARSRST